MTAAGASLFVCVLTEPGKSSRKKCSGFRGPNIVPSQFNGSILTQNRVPDSCADRGIATIRTDIGVRSTRSSCVTLAPKLATQNGVSRDRSSHQGSKSKDHTHQKFDLIQIRADCRIPNAEIAIDPVRHSYFWVEAELVERKPKTASDNKTKCAAVSKFSE